MLLDVKELIVKFSLGDEWCLYKVTKNNKQRFLLFSFGKDLYQAIEKGRKIAKILGVRFVAGEDSNSVEEVNQEKVEVKKKRPRVTGVVKLCRQLLSEKKSDSEIQTILSRKYLDAGYNNHEAILAARGILQGEKKK